MGKIYYVALTTYRAPTHWHLSFEEGQKILFIKDICDGYAKGKIEATGKMGEYPTDLVIAEVKRA